jgi:hypothetical protein
MLVDHDALDQLAAELHPLSLAHPLQSGRKSFTDGLDVLTQFRQRGSFLAFPRDAVEASAKLFYLALEDFPT